MDADDIYYEDGYRVLENKEHFFTLKKQFIELKNYKDKLSFWQEIPILKKEYTRSGYFYPRYLTHRANYDNKTEHTYDKQEEIGIMPDSPEQKILYGKWILDLPKYELLNLIQYWKSKSKDAKDYQWYEDWFKRDYQRSSVFKKAYHAFYDNNTSKLIADYFLQDASNDNWSNAGLYQMKKARMWYEFNLFIGQKDLHKKFEGEKVDLNTNPENINLTAFFKKEREEGYDSFVQSYNEGKAEERENVEQYILGELNGMEEHHYELKHFQVKNTVYSVYAEYKNCSMDEIIFLIRLKLVGDRPDHYSDSNDEARLGYLESDTYLLTILAMDIAYLDFEEHVKRDYKLFLEDKEKFIQAIPILEPTEEGEDYRDEIQEEDESLYNIYWSKHDVAYNELKHAYIKQEIFAGDVALFRMERLEELKRFLSKYDDDPNLDDAITEYLSYKIQGMALEDILFEMEKYLFRKLPEVTDRDAEKTPEFLKKPKLLVGILAEYDALIKYSGFLQIELPQNVKIESLKESIKPKNSRNQYSQYPDILLKDICRDEFISKVDLVLETLERHNIVINFPSGKSKYMDKRKGAKLALIGLCECLEEKGFFDTKKIKDRFYKPSAFCNQFDISISLRSFQEGGKGKDNFHKMLSHIK